MSQPFHVIRLTESRGQRGRWGIAEAIDQWGSGVLSLALVHRDRSFYSESSAHQEARRLNAAEQPKDGKESC